MTPQTDLRELLSDLDSDSWKSRRRSEKALVAIGPDALDSIVRSSHEINLQLLSGYQPDSVLHSLRRRIRILGLIGSTQGIQMISAAIADSADLIYHGKRQGTLQMTSSSVPDVTCMALAEERINIAKQLDRTARKRWCESEMKLWNF